MSKKTLVLLGSPNKNSITKKLVEKLLIDVDTNNITYFDTYKMTIKPCVDCRYCFKEKGCSIKNDDMGKIYSGLEEADNVILASPMHFGTFSAPIMNVFSRLQTYWSALNIRKEEPNTILKRKKGILCMACGAQWLNMELIPNGISHIVFDHINANFDQSFYVKSSDYSDFQNNLELLEKINSYKWVLKK
ncbi:hypothetical protein AZF37_08590 [endosymbiont 'TC1' of Trimyema compressum]|uniref:flavodoxin family protein n=1 Tax=endosymbiont 'TC1' of Trimyema compressum TaxID=243899 RepID=UPI0007F09B00|nr:flavodoxin family protein [endosymbiont 'TC1' of Trimyema compressum]AMP21204.1 hypothetical protein AZF37_08590 [endosymbiont 'TC1' of Trimyema compressum]